MFVHECAYIQLAKRPPLVGFLLWQFIVCRCLTSDHSVLTFTSNQGTKAANKERVFKDSRNSSSDKRERVQGSRHASANGVAFCLNSRNINSLRHLSWFLPKCVLIRFHSSYTLHCFDYADVMWNGYTIECCTKLERLQNYAARIILHKKKMNSATAVRSELGWELLSNRHKLHILTMTYNVRAVNRLIPCYLGDLFTLSLVTSKKHSKTLFQWCMA